MPAMRTAMRSQVERLTRSLVFIRRLPPPFTAARVYVTPVARLGYAFRPLRVAEPHLFDWVETLVRPGHTVWDIGANIGLFAFAAACAAGSHGKIFAFEPDSTMGGLLRRSAALQSPAIAPTEIVPVAVGRALAIRRFAIAARSRASNALAEYGNSQMGGVLTSELVPTVPLDWLLSQLPAPDVIKIDVEGAELEVLEGQNEVLERVRPVIVCEVGNNADAVADLLRAANYRLYDGGRPLRGAAPIDRAAWNTVAVPEEKASLLG